MRRRNFGTRGDACIRSLSIFTRRASAAAWMRSRRIIFVFLRTFHFPYINSHLLGEFPAFSSLGIGGGGGGGGRRDPKSAHQSIVERKKKRKEEKGKGDATPTFPHIAFKRKEKDALRDISLFSFDATAK